MWILWPEKLYFLRTNHSTAGPSQYRKLNRETTQDSTWSKIYRIKGAPPSGRIRQQETADYHFPLWVGCIVHGLAEREKCENLLNKLSAKFCYLRSASLRVPQVYRGVAAHPATVLEQSESFSTLQIMACFKENLKRKENCELCQFLFKTLLAKL